MRISLSDHFTFRKLIRFILPTVVMMIITSVYSIVDGFFVSNLVGKNEFAAVNLVMPVLMALGSFGFMIGTGGTALVAMTLGEGKKKQANEYFSMLVMTVVAVGLVLSLLGFVFMRQIARALGASDLILEDCVLYGRVLLIANPFFMLQNTFQSFLVTAEKPNMGLGISIMAGVGNVIGDFLFIYVFHMGLFGAALATALSETIGGLVPLIYFLRKNKSLLRLVRTKMKPIVLGKACLNGSSEMLTNLSMSLVGMLYNFQLMKLAAENGIAAYGVIMYVSFIFSAFFFGYAIGVGPLVGYHYGAGNHEELKNLFRKSMMITGTAALWMTGLGITMAEPLARIFVGYDQELLAMTGNGMRLYSLSYLMSGFNVFGSAFFTALNNGMLSAVISFLRTLVIQVAAVLVLPVLLGINGIWLAIAAAEGLTILVTGSLLVANRKRYHYV